MGWFKNNSDDTLKKLKQSSQDFKFDQDNIRARILQSVAGMPQPEIRSETWRIPRYAFVALSAIVLLVTGTFAVASQSKPGDTLFPITKLSEELILKLPLPEEQIANIETKIVNRRLEALTQINEDEAPETSVLETVRETNESLHKAVDQIIDDKARLTEIGEEKKVEKLNKALSELESLAGRHEKRLEDLEQKISNKETQEKIRSHLKRFRDSREKARDEIKNRADKKDRD